MEPLTPALATVYVLGFPGFLRVRCWIHTNTDKGKKTTTPKHKTREVTSVLDGQIQLSNLTLCVVNILYHNHYPNCSELKERSDNIFTYVHIHIYAYIYIFKFPLIQVSFCVSGNRKYMCILICTHTYTYAYTYTGIMAGRRKNIFSPHLKVNFIKLSLWIFHYFPSLFGTLLFYNSPRHR
jgi:hypothetical protein